jgi:ABC-type uncharacterized transport system ATPase component
VTSIENLITEAVKSQSKILVVDESTMALDKWNVAEQWITKTSRHAGHSAILIAHMVTDVARGIRDQCTQIFVLGCSRTDAKILYDIYDEKDILQATKLPQLHFIRIYEGRVSFGRVDPATKHIYQVAYKKKPLPALDAEPVEG